MRLVLCAIHILTGAVIFAIPNLTRRELLFAVPVPSHFRESPAGRHAISMFRAAVATVVLAGLCALLLTPAKLLGPLAAALPIAVLLTAALSFYWQNRALAFAAVKYSRPQEVELTAAPDKMPRFTWLAAGPLVILAAAAGWLHLNWDRIPARFPVHFGANGHPNRWAARTTRGVYGPLFFGAEICAWVLIMALATWFGSRRSRFRSVVLGFTIAIEFLLGFVFALVALQPLLRIPGWVFALVPVAVLIPVVVVISNKMSKPAEPMDPTPNECWGGGVFYYNPNDPALFVEKRDGLGYTFNFANRWCWVLLLGLALVIASAPFVLA